MHNSVPPRPPDERDETDGPDGRTIREIDVPPRPPDTTTGNDGTTDGRMEMKATGQGPPPDAEDEDDVDSRPEGKNKCKSRDAKRSGQRQVAQRSVKKCKMKAKPEMSTVRPVPSKEFRRNSSCNNEIDWRLYVFEGEP